MTMEQPQTENSLSFVVPIRGSLASNPSNISRCLLSLMEQRSVYPIDIIIVADGVGSDTKKTDEVWRGIRNLENALREQFINPIRPKKYPQETIPKVRMVLLSDSAGPGGARNAGVGASHSKWIWFIDADDWLTNPDAAQNVLDLLKIQPKKTIGFQFGSFQGPFPCKNSNMMPWLRIIKKSVLTEVPFKENQQTNEDTEQFVSLLNYCKQHDLQLLKITDSPYYYNWMAPGSASDKNNGIIQTKGAS